MLIIFCPRIDTAFVDFILTITTLSRFILVASLNGVTFMLPYLGQANIIRNNLVISVLGLANVLHRACYVVNINI